MVVATVSHHRSQIVPETQKSTALSPSHPASSNNNKSSNKSNTKRQGSITGQLKKLAAKSFQRTSVSASLSGNSTHSSHSRKSDVRKVSFNLKENKIHWIPALPPGSGKNEKLFSTADDLAATLNHARNLCEGDIRVVEYNRCTAKYYNHVCLGAPLLDVESMRRGLLRGYRGLESWSEIGNYRQMRTATVVNMLVDAQSSLRAEYKKKGASAEVIKRMVTEKLQEFSMKMSAESKNWAIKVAAEDALAAREKRKEPTASQNSVLMHKASSVLPSSSHADSNSANRELSSVSKKALELGESANCFDISGLNHSRIVVVDGKQSKDVFYSRTTHVTTATAITDNDNDYSKVSTNQGELFPTILQRDISSHVASRKTEDFEFTSGSITADANQETSFIESRILI